MYQITYRSIGGTQDQRKYSVAFAEIFFYFFFYNENSDYQDFYQLGMQARAVFA